ncbi:tail assembly chaperone [Streptomyces phage Amethyst]|uniref:Tail assembly chaperone n=1 Tax=Streptomyces phage Amethyst TaxID=2041205 RepID=A0A291LGZ2_9CAUD|nr:tail assembly chaperone [Streptomyces phage Amethyst]ATI18639.1 tail assembly chaperone [Streptomyces phage Amethyst]
MAVFSLDSIREAAEAKYGSTDIEVGDGFVARLLNPLRLPKEKRAELLKIQDKLDGDDVDQELVLADAIRLVAENETAAEKLLDAIGSDLAVLAQIFETYSKGTQVGGSLGLGELIDKYGDGLYPDLLFHYGVDLTEVIAGRGPSPALVLSLVQRLPDTSLTMALASGGREHFGWGIDRHMSADIFDAINQNTRATGQWGKGKAPKIPLWPRPKVKKSTEGAEGKKGRRVSVADLYKKFQGKRR